MIHFSGVIALIILFTALLWFTIGWWVSSIERAKQQRNRETEWNHHLNTLRRDRDAFRDQVEVAHGKIRVLEHRRADGKSPPSSPEDKAASSALTERLQKHLEAAKQQISGFARKVDALREQSIEREDVLEQLKKKLTDTSRALHERDQNLAELNGQEEPAIQTLAAPAPQPASDKRIARYEETVQKLRIEVQTQADAAEQDRQRLDHTISEHMQTIGALRSELAQRDAMSNAVPGAEPENPELDTVRHELEELKQENQRHVVTIDQLAQGSKVVEHQRSRLNALQADYDEQRTALEELAHTADDHEKHREKFAGLEAQSRDQHVTIEQLKESRQGMETQRDQALEQLASLREEALRQNDGESIGQHTELSETISEHEQTITRLRQQDAEREQEYDSELFRLRQAMDAQEQIVSQLREVLSKPANKVTRPAARAVPRVLPPQSGDLFAPATTAVPNSPSIKLYEQAPATSDNLKKINGIGPAFERALNDLGLFEFEQIAALSDNDIEWVAMALRSFPDRIVKGQWIEQAQNLIARRSQAR